MCRKYRLWYWGCDHPVEPKDPNYNYCLEAINASWAGVEPLPCDDSEWTDASNTLGMSGLCPACVESVKQAVEAEWTTFRHEISDIIVDCCERIENRVMQRKENVLQKRRQAYASTYQGLRAEKVLQEVQRMLDLLKVEMGRD
ncbi:hypothetical protein DL767_003697 [Monosporascus sp. MG133]|nr:hypothetical protein DL767_003697 [Monosporascus sp. MG133]